MCTIRYNTSRKVGVLKVVQLQCSHQQCLVAEWSGRSVTVRVRAIGPGNGIFPFCVKNVTKQLCLGTV